MLIFLVQVVSAFTVSPVSVDPSGILNPGDPVNVSFTVYAAMGTAFSSYDDLQFVTELAEPIWRYSIVVNGIENIRPADKGSTLTISGYELAYQNRDEVLVKTILMARVPSSSVSGTNKTLVKVQELDMRGNVIPYSVVTVDHLIGQPTPPPTPAFGRISVTSDPAGANIYLDNMYKGLSPLTIENVPNGGHVVMVRLDSYEDSVHTVVVTADTRMINATLTPLTAQRTITPAKTTVAGTTPRPTATTEQVISSGSLSVVTSPPGARVYVDDLMKGITPTTIPGLSAGTHRVVIMMDGYQTFTTEITVNAGQTSEYRTGLSPSTKTPGFGLTASVVSLGILFVLLKIKK